MGVGRWLLPLPALVALGLVLRFGVDVPYMDGWDTPGALLVRATERPLVLADLVGQHNETRPAFPRLVFLAVAWTVGWHAKLYMLLSWGCLAVTAWALHRLVARHLQAGWWSLGIALLLQALLFSPIQHENQLWGVQLVVFVPAACLVTMLLLASTERPMRLVFPACAALAGVATYSYANGMICWLLGCPAPWLVLRRRAGGPSPSSRGSLAFWTAGWACVALAVVGTYLYGYQSPAHHDGFDALWSEPARVARFLLAWLGLPVWALSRQVVGAQILGLVLVVAGTALLAPLLWRGVARREWRRLADLWPWLALLAYGGASGLAAAAGRALMAMEIALAGRYASFALWIPIAVLGVVAASQRYADLGRRARGARRALVLGLALLVASSWARGLWLLPDHQRQREQRLITVRFVEALPHDPLLPRVHPRPEVVRERISVLRRHDILPIAPEGSFLPRALRQSEQGATSGEWSARRLGQARRLISGVARLPDTGRAPEAVLVAIATPDGAPAPLTVLAPHPRGPEARFSEVLPLKAGFPSTDLRVYAVDLERETLHPLARGRPPEVIRVRERPSAAPR